MGIEPTTNRFYSQTLCPCATTGLFDLNSFIIRFPLTTMINKKKHCRKSYYTIFTLLYFIKSHFINKSVFITYLMIESWDNNTSLPLLSYRQFRADAPEIADLQPISIIY